MSFNLNVDDMGRVSKQTPNQKTRGLPFRELIVLLIAGAVIYLILNHRLPAAFYAAKLGMVA